MTDEEYQQQQLEQQEQNLALWNAVCMTDPAHTKSFNNGSFQGTAIDPQWQRHQATLVFGAYGIGWGIKPDSEVVEHIHPDGGTILTSYRATMFYKHGDAKGEFPINASIKTMYQTKSGYAKVDDDYMKKLQTDALTKGLSFLGFNADVFMGKFDDNKYVAEAADHFKPKFTGDQLEAFNKLILNKNKGDDYSLFCMEQDLGQESFGALMATIQSDPAGKGKRSNKTKKREAVGDLINAIQEPLAEYIDQIEGFTTEGNDDAIAELMEELKKEPEPSKKYVWRRLSKQAQKAFKRNTTKEAA